MSDFADLGRIDSFPYRHRLRDVMTAPALVATVETPLAELVRRMDAARASSVVAIAENGRPIGIFTERDLLHLLATRGPAGLELPLGAMMTQGVVTVDADAFIHVAIARMARHGFRHLVVVDGDGRPVGMVTGRALLKIRTTTALALGDEVEEAGDSGDMKAALAKLPRLAAGLLAEGVDAATVASVIAATVRGLTARSAQLAEQAMAEEGWGAPPARYAFLVLGSAGRGESLLAFDQDNAIVHAGGAEEDRWFAELGRRVNAMLDEAGIPLCQGGVMAREKGWRRGAQEWRDEIRRWVYEVANQTVMYCDIFFDFQPVWGDRGLAEELRVDAIEMASQSAFFMQYLAQHVAGMESAIGLFGRFITRSGRVNAKKYALLPLVSAARMRAIRARLAATATDDRWSGLAALGQLHPDDLRDFVEIRALVMRLMLDRQLAAIAAGGAPNSDIELRRLDRGSRERLRWAFRRLAALKLVCGVGG